MVKYRYLGFMQFVLFLVISNFSSAEEIGFSGAQYTEVVDAFDTGDPYDFHLSLEYQYTYNKNEISRECYAGSCTESAIKDYIYYEKLIESVEKTHILNITGLFGIYHDLHLKIGVPIFLQKSASLDVHPDVEENHVANLLTDPFSGEKLFNVPFASSDRSGVDYFVTGLEWGVLNQERNEAWPNWNIFIEGLWGVGPIMKPAGSDNEGKKGATDKPGISRGNIGLSGGTKIGKRFKYINPYFGFEFLFEFPKREAPYPFNNERIFDGQVNLKPPMRGYINIGIEIIPYEAPARQQKFFVDLRFIGGYISEGRDYSPLFDALGTTSDPALNFFKGSPDWWNSKVGDSNFASHWNEWYGDGESLYYDNSTMTYRVTRTNKPYDPYKKETWTGLTDQENYGTFGGRFQIGFVTSKWFKIMAGLSIIYNQPHFITFTDECNSATFDRSSTDPTDTNCIMGNVGGTHWNKSSFNPDYRVILDEPGNRFKISATLIIGAFVNAVAMF